MYIDEAGKNCMPACPDGSLSVPPAGRPRRPRMHNTVASHCDFSTPHNGGSVRHRYEEIALNKKIDRLGLQNHGLHRRFRSRRRCRRALAPIGHGRSTGNCGMDRHVNRIRRRIRQTPRIGIGL